MMDADEFKPLMARVAAWWPGTKWTEAMIAVWFEDLRRFPVGDVRIALEQLKREHTLAFAPAIGAVLSLLERDEAGIPTFDEAFRLIFKAAAYNGPERMAWLRQRSELVATFLQEQGPDYVWMLPIEDPEWGPQRRRELREAWDRFLGAYERRQVAVLAAGKREGLRKLNSGIVSLEDRRRLPEGHDRA